MSQQGASLDMKTSAQKKAKPNKFQTFLAISRHCERGWFNLMDKTIWLVWSQYGLGWVCQLGWLCQLGSVCQLGWAGR